MAKERSFAGHERRRKPGIATAFPGRNESLAAESERRRKPRIATPFPAIVRGVNEAGEAFEVESVLDNISSGGLYVRLGQRVKKKTKLEFFIRMSAAANAGAAMVQARGIVLRVEARPAGLFGLAVKLTHHRFT
jgi:hypothetical protein